MKHYFNIHRLWFRAAATGIACLFLFNNIASAAGRPVSSIKNIHTLSTTSEFNPITLTQGKKDDLGFVKDQMEGFNLVQDFQEKAGFIYLSLLISRALARGVASKLSAQGLRNLIKKQIPHIDFKKIHLEKMYKEGQDIYCLPFTPEKGAKTRILRYYMPRETSGASFSRNSTPIGIGNVRIECEGLEDISTLRNRKKGTDPHYGRRINFAAEHAATQESISSEMPGSRETGMREGKDRLSRINFGAEKDYYFMLGDVDKLSNRNKIYSKGVIGSLGQSTDPDVIFSKKSLFREILTSLAEKCNAEELEVYRYLAGDEFVPQCDRGSVDGVEAKLNLIRKAFKNHFENRYAVAKVDDLTESEQISLFLNENVLAVVKYGSGYHVLLKRNGTNLKVQLQILNEYMEHDLSPHEFNEGTIPAFTVSMGAISARSIIDSLGGDALLDEAGYIKTEELDRVYTWGMRIANDMLSAAKETRDTVFVSDSIDPEILKKPIKLEKEKPIKDGLDRLTGFYNPGRFRDEAKKKKNLVLFEVTTYNGHPSREIGGFHAVNSALGYDDANDVIAIMAEELKAVLDDMKIGDVVFGRAPPDRFFVSMDRDIGPALLETILLSIKKKVEDRLAKRFGKSSRSSRFNRRTDKRFQFDINFKISAVSSEEIERSHIPEFNNIFNIIETISKLEKAAEITGAVEETRAVIHREEDGIGEIRIYSSNKDKEELLRENYRAIQEREKQEAMDDAGRVTVKPAGEAEEAADIDLIGDPVLHLAIPYSNDNADEIELLDQVDEFVISLREISVPSEERKKIEDVLLELGFNIMEHGAGGNIWVFLEKDTDDKPIRIRVISKDNGEGLHDRKGRICSPDELVRRSLAVRKKIGAPGSADHDPIEKSDRGMGLSEISLVPDGATIEYDGRKWGRINDDENAAHWFEEQDVSDITDGTKFTLDFDLSPSAERETKQKATLKEDGFHYFGGGIAPEKPQSSALSEPATAIERFAALLEEQFDVETTAREGFERPWVGLFSLLGREDVMMKMRDPDVPGEVAKDLIIEKADEMPEAKLVAPLEVLPVISEEGTTTPGLYLGLIKSGRGVKNTRLAVIKLFPPKERVSAATQTDDQEITKAQLLYRMGFGPRVFGVVREASGKAIGFAMEVVPGEPVPNEIEPIAVNRADHRRALLGMDKAGTTQSPFLQVPNPDAAKAGEPAYRLVGVDAGNIVVMNPEEYHKKIRELNEEARRAAEFPAKTIDPNAQSDSRMYDVVFDEAVDAAKEKATAESFIDAVISRQFEIDDPEKKLFVFLGTKWIKGYQKGEDAESDPLNDLLLAVRQFCGKWGIELMVEGDEENWAADIKAIQDANKGAKFVVVTGEKIVVTPEFRALGENENTVLAGISNEDLTIEYDVYVLQVLTALIRIASGEKIDNIDTEILIKTHNDFPGIYVLSLPPARLLDIDKQKRKYRVQEKTVRKAA